MALYILKEHFPLSLEFYARRKQYLMDKLHAQIDSLIEQVKFVSMIHRGDFVLVNKTTKEIFKFIIEGGFRPDPVKLWQQRVKVEEQIEEYHEKDASKQKSGMGSETVSPELTDDEKYGYLLNIPMYSLTRRRKRALVNLRDWKLYELRKLRETSLEDLWSNDLQQKLKKMMQKSEIKVTKPIKFEDPLDEKVELKRNDNMKRATAASLNPYNTVGEQEGGKEYYGNGSNRTFFSAYKRNERYNFKNLAWKRGFNESNEDLYANRKANFDMNPMEYRHANHLEYDKYNYQDYGRKVSMQPKGNTRKFYGVMFTANNKNADRKERFDPYFYQN